MTNNGYTVTISVAEVDHFRLMLREQFAGDRELIRDLLVGREQEEQPAVDRRLTETTSRLAFVERLAVQAGGLY
jgi:hypothetical protein